MTEERRNRIVGAITVNVILLITILIAVIVYQLVRISIDKRTKNDIIEQIEYYEQETEKKEDTLEYYKSQQGLVDLAYKYGFMFGK